LAGYKSARESKKRSVSLSSVVFDFFPGQWIVLRFVLSIVSAVTEMAMLLLVYELFELALVKLQPLFWKKVVEIYQGAKGKELV